MMKTGIIFILEINSTILIIIFFSDSQDVPELIDSRKIYSICKTIKTEELIN